MTDYLDALRAKALRPIPPALHRLSIAFDLDDFEQQLVMLAFALETDHETAQLIAEVCGQPSLAGVPVVVAHLVLGSEDWLATSPAAPLLRWHILEETAPAPRALMQLTLADNVTDALLGAAALDRALTPYCTPLSAYGDVSAPLVQALVDALSTRCADGFSPVIVAPWADGLRTAAVAAEALGLKPYRVDPDLLTLAGERLPMLQRLWERDVAMRPALPIIEYPSDPAAVLAVEQFCSGLASHVVLLGDATPAGLRRSACRVPQAQLSHADIVGMWRTALGDRASGVLNGSVELAAAHFGLPPEVVATIADQTRQSIEVAADEQTAHRLLWEACAKASWPEPGSLAQVSLPRAGWEAIVVPAAVRDDLQSIVRHVRHSATVFDGWGFGATVNRGRGLLALFAGPSGTGKTLAAEVIATQLQLPLVKADFSQLQSKWVGETPKLVGRLFDQMQLGGAVLLIDEADGLIGRRGAVVEAHDRHANVEVAYFLQRLEDFRGLAILTTNLKSAIDEAFIRRFRFVVDFPLPSQEQRSLIWQRVFPADAPMADVDTDLFARLPLSGGAIRNVALNAAFLAAEDGAAISGHHIRSALKVEYRKLERSAAEIELGLQV